MTRRDEENLMQSQSLWWEGEEMTEMNIIVSIEGGTYGDFDLSSKYVMSTEIHLILQTI